MQLWINYVLKEESINLVFLRVELMKCLLSFRDRTIFTKEQTVPSLIGATPVFELVSLYVLSLCALTVDAFLPIVVLESERVELLELDEFTLVGRQEDTAHKARYSQLLDYLEQVNLHVKLAESFGVQPLVLLCSRTLCSPLATAAPPGRDQATAEDKEQSLLEVGPEALGPIVAEDVPRHDCLLQLALFGIVFSYTLVLTIAQLEEGTILVSQRLLPREDLLDQRFVECERLVAGQSDISHPRD